MFRVICFAFAVVLAGAVPTPSRAAEVDNLLPKETEFVVQFNIQQLVESDIVKRNYLPQFQKGFENKEVQKFLAAIGLDPFRDIEKMTIGLWGKPSEKMNAVLLIRGRFDIKKMSETADGYAKDKPDMVSRIQEGEIDLIEIKSKQDDPNYIAMIDGKPIIAGSDKKAVASAAAVAEGAKPALSRELQALVLKQDAKASIFLCGFTADKFTEIPDDWAPLKNFGIDGDKIKAGFLKMKSFGLTVNFGKEVVVNAKMGMKDPDSADDFSAEFGKLANAAKLFLPVITASSPENAGLIEDVSKTLATSSKGNDVTLSLKISADAIEKSIPVPKEKNKGKEDKDK